MTRSRTLLLSTVLLSLSSANARIVRAADTAAKQACLTAADDGQDRRSEGKLRAARDRFLACAAASCPGAVRKECEKWVTEVDASLPSIVVSATHKGIDVFAVKVTFDGVPLLAQLDGKAIAVDPGVHAFAFETEGAARIERQIVIKEGEKNRPVAVAFDPPPSPSTPAATPSTSTSAGVSTGTSTRASSATDTTGGGASIDDSKPSAGRSRAVPYVLTAVGVVALGSFAYFGLTGAKGVGDLKSSCAPSCAQDDLDAQKRKLLVADVSLGIGVVALGVATYMFLSAPSQGAPSTSARTFELDVRSVAGGGLAELHARF